MSSFVDQSIKSHKVCVFSKTYCPYAAKAKQVLGKYNLNDICIVELDKRDDGDAIQDYLGKITGARTVRYFICFFYL